MRKIFFGSLLLVVLIGAYAMATGGILSSFGPILLLAFVCFWVALLPPLDGPLLEQAVLPALAAFLFGLAFWSAAPSISTYPAVTLTVTGEKNAAALGTEVWVVGVGSASGSVSVAGLDGWAQRGTAVVGFEGTEKTIQIPQGWPYGGIIRFGTSPYSGVVEIAVDGKRSRIDLYSAASNSMDVTLPGTVDTAFSMPFRIAATLLFSWALFLLIMRASQRKMNFRYFVTFATMLTAIVVWLGTAKMSAPGTVELLFVNSETPTLTEPGQATVYLGTGYDYADGLPLPVKNYATQEALLVSNSPTSVTLQPSVSPTSVLTQVGGGRGQDKGLVCSRETPLVAEFDPQQKVSVRIIEGAGSEVALTAPELPSTTGADAASNRRFLVCWPYRDGLLIAWSSAYVKYGDAWSAPVGAVERVRLDRPDLHAVALRLSSGSSQFSQLQPLTAGEFSYPRIPTSMTHADLARRSSTALIAALCVLLLIPIAEVFKSLRSLESSGHGAAARWAMLTVSAWMTFAMVVAWPSFIGPDAFSPFSLHGVGGKDLWYGIGYPLLVSALINLGGPELSLLLKVLVTGIVILWASFRALEVGAKGLVVCGYLVAMLALTGTTMVAATELRDAVNGVALSSFGIYVFTLMTTYRTVTQPIPLRHWVLLAILGALIVLLRIDNIVFLGPLLAGLSLGRHWRRTLPACLAIVAIWMSATPAVVRYVVDRGDHGELEMRLYKQTAYINPLVGMLRGDSLSPEEKAQLAKTLDKVLNVDFAVEHWAPSDIIYWHQSHKGPGTPEVISALQKAFVMNALRHPIEFITLRSATSLKALGMDNAAAWLANKHIQRTLRRVPYYDHVARQDAYGKSMVLLSGYRPPTHLFPEVSNAVLSWYSNVALATPQLLAALILVFGFRLFPVTSLLAFAVVLRAALFWLAQPASIFMYLSELQILGTLLPILGWIEWRQRSLAPSYDRSRVSPAMREQSPIPARSVGRSLTRPSM